MCNLAVVGNARNELKTAGDVRRELNTPIVLIEGVSFEPTDDQCLCTVDVVAMAKNAGRQCEYVGQDWDNWAWIDFVIDPDSPALGGLNREKKEGE